MLVACSGGADSLALLHLLLGGPWPVLAAHLDHAGREDSAEQARRVRAHLETVGVPCWVRRLHVQRWAQRYGTSWEATARTLRYTWLDRLCRQQRAMLVTGHTLDDQAETVLMRAIQGTTLTGLAGIEPRRERLCRPLLGCRRAELRSWLEAQGIAWFEDPGNRDPRFLRNRVRHALLPLVESLNPQAVEHLARLAADAQELKQRQTAGSRLEFEDSLHALWLELNPTPGARWSRDHSERIYRAVGAQQPGLWTLPGGIWAEYYPPKLYLGRGERRLPGLQRVEGVSAQPVQANAVVLEPAACAAVCWRFWEPGDRLAGRLLKKCWNDWRVPRALRVRIPLLCDGQRVLWVPGYAVAPEAEWKREAAGGVRFSFEERSAWKGVEAPRRDVSTSTD